MTGHCKVDFYIRSVESDSWSSFLSISINSKVWFSQTQNLYDSWCAMRIIPHVSDLTLELQWDKMPIFVPKK